MIKNWLFACCMFTSGIFAQVGTGQWRLHVASKAIDIAAGQGIVLAALETGILEYDPAENESSIWTDVNSLSDIQLSCIYFDPNSQGFFVGYENGNMDRIDGNTVTNIPAIKLSQVQGSKTVNKFISKGDFVYASTDFGIVVINTKNNEIKDSYYPTNGLEPILEVAFLNDSIFALTEKNLYKGSINNLALADPAQWVIDSRVPSPGAHSYHNLAAMNGELYLAYKNNAYGLDSVYKITNSGLQSVVDLGFDMEIEKMKIEGNQVYLTLFDAVIILDESFSLKSAYNTYSFSNTVEPKQAVTYQDAVYIADIYSGMVQFIGSTSKKIQMSGPPKNNFFALGGREDKVCVAGGVINKTGFQFSGAGAYVFKDEDWSLIDKGNQSIWTGKNIFDISCVAVNPINKDELAIGSFSEQPVSIASNGITIDALYDEDNAPLETIAASSENICVSDLEYDRFGNLWVLNGYAGKPLKVLTKDKLWYDFDCGSSIKNKYSGRMAIDYNDNKWFTIYDQGLIGFNDGGTIDDPSDDKYVQLNDGVNSGALPGTNVTAVAVDFDNEIWIGTTNGFAILYNSANAFDAAPGEYNAQRIKIDFEGNVEYLLGNTSITDIEIDGGNRKWIGTANAGIFLLSADGLEILESFTTENSPLISDNIVDMQFNSKTGELFIVTDVGLISLRTDASTGDSEYKNVSVFPNPVKPEFNGLITIQGIKYDSDVKFTDAAGNLVYETTSNGGTATWNGKDFDGKKVAAGVYLIWTASNTQKGRKVGKVVIVN